MEVGEHTDRVDVARATGEGAGARRSFARSGELAARLSALVPGGAHTYAKGEDQFPEGMAPIMERGSGCRVRDVDGNEYIEYGMGLRAVTLGHGYPSVAAAVAAQLEHGTNFVRPSRLELEAAESFLGLVTRAEMVKFTKDGSTANTGAVKLARAFTGRDRVALCVDHPFFSYDDWAMVTTPVRAGIPSGVEEQTSTFRYDDLESVEELLRRHPGEIACFVLEVERATPPSPDFLPRLQELVHADGALLVLDENVTGFRWHTGGAQELHDLTPDLSTWGKGIANGFALSALAGRREIMELGGLDHDRERVFLLSTTHGAEHVGLAAGIATMAVYRDEPVVETLHARGERLQAGVQQVARRHGVEERFTVAGRGSCLFFGTADAAGAPSQELRTLFLQETIERGLLAPSFVVSYSHTEDDIDRTVEIVDEALAVYAAALEVGVDRFLRGRPVKPVYRRFN
ncbi:MAG TPA: glutamate-1-semialdehyde 2,1-aminomutase [Gaiella sp.]|nr:glutamate-1-semialdehyde 2,1-aminomutase [Gaiella sp.]HEX5583459.1 glutamate-1-semialdehyde 2,1-aminomutase [Gaiella sp.]